MPKPSPWKGLKRDEFSEEYMFNQGAFPPNSKPFIRRLNEMLDEYGTNSLQSLAPESTEHLRARALLWVLNAQVFGQLAVIDMSKEWETLHDALNARKF